MDLDVIDFCAEECVRQQSGEMSVADMVWAWKYAQDYSSNPDATFLTFIERVGQIIEPVDNKGGFRQIPIFVRNGWDYIEKTPWERVPSLLSLLLESYYEGALEPVHPKAITREDQFYFEYENIHPFKDGNGRSGKILYNFLLGTLDKPVMPPNFWGSSNP